MYFPVMRAAARGRAVLGPPSPCYVPVSGLPGFRRPLKGHWWTLIDLNARANDGWLGASKRLTEADGS